MTIREFKLDPAAFVNQVTAPIVKPLCVVYHGFDPYLTAIVDPERQPEEYIVCAFDTGWDFDLNSVAVSPEDYLNTTSAGESPCVWHWFCRKLIQSSDM